MNDKETKFFTKGPWLSLIIGLGFIYSNIMMIITHGGIGISKNHMYYIPVIIVSLFFIRSTLNYLLELIASSGLALIYILEFFRSFMGHGSGMMRVFIIYLSIGVGMMFIYFWYDGFIKKHQ